MPSAEQFTAKGHGPNGDTRTPIGFQTDKDDTIDVGADNLDSIRRVVGQVVVNTDGPLGKDGTGVFGTSRNGIAVYRTSDSDDGVKGETSRSANGVSGEALDNGSGVSGHSNLGPGISGRSESNYA
jgi:hypothetical protein